MKKRLTKAEKGVLRLTIWTRQYGLCLWCGKPFTLKQMHCHEVKPRGKGGQMSLENSIGLCFSCHIDKAHGKRKPQFTKTKKELDSAMPSIVK